MCQILTFPMNEYVCTVEFEDLSCISETITAPSLDKAIDIMEANYPNGVFVGGIALQE